MSAVEDVADFWDAHTARWLEGDDELRSPLDRWFASYAGGGIGVVDREAFAEPYAGDLRGNPRFVILGLNPGDVSLDFQGRNGVFANSIRDIGSYSAWAATHAELPVTDVFAFGAEWARALKRLGMAPVDHLGRGGRDWGSTVPSRTILVYVTPSRQRLIVAWHAGSAGPPRAEETERLRDALASSAAHT